MVSKGIANNLFKVCNITIDKNEEITRFISRKMDTATELVANKIYLEKISKKDYDSTFDTKSLFSILI